MYIFVVLNNIFLSVFLQCIHTMASKSLERSAPSCDVVCKLCLKPFNDPRILPCLHSFCKECLEKEVEKAGTEQDCRCPASKCKQSFKLPRGSVISLPRNLHLSSNVEVANYQAKVSGGAHASCESCDDSTSGPAVMFCIECRELLCQLCTDFHRRVRKTKQHKLIDVGEKSVGEVAVHMKPKQFYCTEMKHEEEVLRFYCETCQQLICRDCIVIEHKDHKHADLAGVASSHRNEMKLLFNPAIEAIASLDSAISNSDQVMQEVRSQSKAVSDEIEKVFELVKCRLEARKLQLLAQNQETCLAKVTTLTL